MTAGTVRGPFSHPGFPQLRVGQQGLIIPAHRSRMEGTTTSLPRSASMSAEA